MLQPKSSYSGTIEMILNSFLLTKNIQPYCLLLTVPDYVKVK